MSARDPPTLNAAHEGGQHDRTPLVRRLALPKSLFREAKRALSQYGPYSGGMAASLLQDSVESFLRILAEHGRVNLNDTAPFNALLEKVGERFPSVLEHKAAISRLNRARVAFKHHGLVVSNDDALYFVVTVDSFLTELSSNVLDTDFLSISLITQIGHRRTKNWLHKAEDMARVGAYNDSLICAAKAMAIYSNYSSRWMDSRHYDNLSPLLDVEDDCRLEELTNWITEQLESIMTHLDLMMQGIDIAAYRRFLQLTPTVYFSAANTVRVSSDWPHDETFEPTKDEVEFCIDFVLESAMSILDTRPHGCFNRYSTEDTQTAVADSECEVIVYPGEDPPEVIQEVPQGETLPALRKQGHSYPGFTAVILDDEISYVRSEHIRLLDDEAHDA